MVKVYQRSKSMQMYTKCAKVCESMFNFATVFAVFLSTFRQILLPLIQLYKIFVLALFAKRYNLLFKRSTNHNYIRRRVRTFPRTSLLLSKRQYLKWLRGIWPHDHKTKLHQHVKTQMRLQIEWNHHHLRYTHNFTHGLHLLFSLL